MFLAKLTFLSSLIVAFTTTTRFRHWTTPERITEPIVTTAEFSFDIWETTEQTQKVFETTQGKTLFFTFCLKFLKDLTKRQMKMTD